MTRRLGPEELHALRPIPLSAGLRASGARPERYARKQWHTAQGSLSVTDMQFMNWSRGQGGAIDLAMHLRNLDFPAALAWLRQRCWVPVPSPPTRVGGGPLRLPPPDAHPLFTVERYLVRQRALPQKLIAAVIQSGELYADARANAVFLLREQDREPVGAELRGTGPVRWPGLAPAPAAISGYFRVQPASPTARVLCESAIDALSCHVLHPASGAISTHAPTHLGWPCSRSRACRSTAASMPIPPEISRRNR